MGYLSSCAVPEFNSLQEWLQTSGIYVAIQTKYLIIWLYPIGMHLHLLIALRLAKWLMVMDIYVCQLCKISL